MNAKDDSFVASGDLLETHVNPHAFPCGGRVAAIRAVPLACVFDQLDTGAIVNVHVTENGLIRCGVVSCREMMSRKGR